jgi:hypothetical protein
VARGRRRRGGDMPLGQADVADEAGEQSGRDVDLAGHGDESRWNHP